MSTKKAAKQNPKAIPIWWFAIFALGLAILAGLAYAALNRPATTTGLPLEITVAQAAEKYKAGAYILDVREPSEWEEAHIPGATLIPLGQLASRISEIPTDREVVVVCRSGNRSATARDILRKAGLSQVTSMAGGINQWKASGNQTKGGK